MKVKKAGLGSLFLLSLGQWGTLYGMSSRVFLALGILLIFVFLIILILPVSHDVRRDAALLEVTYFDVGQGDATFIESPTGTQVLIDGGPDASVLRGLADTMGFFDRTIDMVVATHPDLDHIAGLVDVLERYRVQTILMTENESGTPVNEAFLSRVRDEGAEVIMARRGQIFDLGRGVQGSTTLTILFPDRDPQGLESNTSSIVSRLVYGENEFVFTGDSPIAIEEYLVDRNDSILQSDVLKAGHHGSDTSSSELFVGAVAPTYAIISAGRDNRYGHPHTEVTERFATFGIETKNTAESGSIFMVSDGRELWFR